ncbi:MAG: hypothetical protein LBR42_00005 [Candidatus Methanoplasma sp.]|jgi:hypothetical protein|nr:hypothetical protein [Candidatus Methanoplasma sp.]
MGGKSRPILVGLIGLITLIVAVLTISLSVLSIIDSEIVWNLISDYTNVGLASTLGYAGLIGGIIILIIGLSIWRGWTIAWYIAVILYALTTIVAIAGLIMQITGGRMEAAFMIPAIIMLLIFLLILFYLFTPKVKAFFTV